ncbi:hypothetical protein SFRURICE_011557 [Spodoptera frugiperda]|nr:hypothetical protein SFRURICE_011557 [Spodoptera frugiperda]
MTEVSQMRLKSLESHRGRSPSLAATAMRQQHHIKEVHLKLAPVQKRRGAPPSRTFYTWPSVSR